MPTFLYQKDLEDGRLVITTPEDLNSDFRLTLSEVEAPDWISAKQQLGFELTDLQAELLPLDETGRAKVLARERWYGFGGAVFGLKEINGLLKGHQTEHGWVYGH